MAVKRKNRKYTKDDEVKVINLFYKMMPNNVIPRIANEAGTSKHFASKVINRMLTDSEYKKRMLESAGIIEDKI